MQIKQQWLVGMDGSTCLLIETFKDGYFIQHNGNFKSILASDAVQLIYSTKQDAG
jgi:hypothetical protein